MATQDPVALIRDNPKYLELKRKRSGFGWLLTAIPLGKGGLRLPALVINMIGKGGTA